MIPCIIILHQDIFLFEPNNGRKAAKDPFPISIASRLILKKLTFKRRRILEKGRIFTKYRIQKGRTKLPYHVKNASVGR